MFKKTLLNLFILFFIITLFGCSNPTSSENQTDNSYQLLEFTAVQSETATNAVTLTWRNSIEVYKYNVYYNKTNDSSTATKASGAGYASDEYDSAYKKTGFYKGTKDVSLSESGTYYFWITAVTKDNSESEFSKGVSCSFIYSSLTAPIDISAVQSETSYNNVTVTWRDSKEAYKYYIYYNTTNDSSTATKVSGNGYVSDEYDSSYKKTGFYKGSKDVTLSESGTYYFWVKAVDGTNHESEFSTVATFTLN